MTNPSLGSRFPVVCRLSLLPLLLAVLAACQGVPGGQAPPPRAILASIDAVNEASIRRYMTPDQVPALFRLLDDGMCAAHAESHFPSVTAASHAVIWTGAAGDVHRVTANSVPRLPRDAHTVMETTNGFHYSTLSAEPIWITAGKAGVPVAGHHVTQGPGVPGYPAVQGARTPFQEARRSESARILARTDVNVLNGYNRIVEGQRILTGADVAWDDPAEAPWANLDALGSRLPPVPFHRDLPEGGRLHGVLLALPGEGDAGLVARGPAGGDTGGDAGAPGYNAMLLGMVRDAERAVMARAAPVETTPPGPDRPLARFFAEALEVEVEGGRFHVQPRLFEVAPDGRDFLLYQPPLQVVEGNREELTLAYDREAGGWTGNAGNAVYLRGGFGPRLTDGGDGTAEARFLETAEHLLLRFSQGSRWLWDTWEPRLMVDYFPLADEIDHRLMGFLDPASPGYTPELAERVVEFRTRTWQLVDRWLATLEELAREAGAALFVTGDHGMRGNWQLFLPNLALQEAGLQVLDEAGEVDLSRTRAVSTHGYWVTVNRTAFRGGIVPPEEEAGVRAAVVAALEGVRTPDGNRVVTRTFTPEQYPDLGLGGPAGGDVYWGTAPGFRSSGALRGEGVIVDSWVGGDHGFPPDEPDMYTVFCALGGGFEAGRFPPVRTTVVAPTVAAYLGMPAPADAVAPSVLDWMRRGADPLEEALRDRIDAEVRAMAEEGGDAEALRVAVAFRDLSTAHRTGILADRPFHAASTMKVPVLYELYRRHDDGELEVGDPVRVRNTFRSVHDRSPFTLESDSDSGLLDALGGSLPARRLAHGMITVSSNLATNILLEELGPEAVQARMDRLGAGEMRVRRGVSDIPAFEAGYSNETTARGLLRVMEVIAGCEELSRPVCDEVHRILEDQAYRSEIPAGVPPGTRVGNKTGSITRIRHDAAIVHREGRSPYLLVILTEGFDDGARASALMADLSRLVWEAVGGTSR
jgi:beta-lactamase class A/predicted AlkP superfamily phosphohydrolase/phosphomutase